MKFRNKSFVYCSDYPRFISTSITGEVLLFVVCHNHYDITWFCLSYDSITNCLFWHNQIIQCICFTYRLYWQPNIVCLAYQVLLSILYTIYVDITSFFSLCIPLFLTYRLLWHNQILSVLHTVYCDIARSCLFYFAISAYNTITSCTNIFTTVLVSIFYKNIW